MRPASFLTFILATFLIGSEFSPMAHAVALVSGSNVRTFNTTAPTSATVANWDSGWAASGVTGWDYVGQVNGASGVYLGNGFVLTAGHVGAGDFTLAGTTYSAVIGSDQNIGTADLTLFQIATSPSLPSLTISTTPPRFNSSIVIIGYGGGTGETWASNTIAGNTTPVQLGSFTTTDFYSNYSALTNSAQVITGDSGGADFRYNTTTRAWELAGLNEAYTTDTNGNYARSYFVQLATYKTQISAATFTAAPEPGSLALLALSGSLALLRRRRAAR